MPDAARAPVGEFARRARSVLARAGDPEAAHGAEDQLWADALKAIADGHPKPADVARAALKTPRGRLPEGGRSTRDRCRRVVRMNPSTDDYVTSEEARR